jgi:hypothetical protein
MLFITGSGTDGGLRKILSQGVVQAIEAVGTSPDDRQKSLENVASLRCTFKAVPGNEPDVTCSIKATVLTQPDGTTIIWGADKGGQKSPKVALTVEFAFDTTRHRIAPSGIATKTGTGATALPSVVGEKAARSGD